MFKRKQSIYKNLTFKQYEKLTPDEREKVNYILNNALNAVPYLKCRKRILRPKRNNIWLYLYEEIIDIRNGVNQGDLEFVVLRYIGKKKTKFGRWLQNRRISRATVYSYLSFVKYISEGLEQINEAEKRLENNKDKDLWKQAGIEKMGEFGELTGLFFASGGILDKKSILLKTPYGDLFDWKLTQKTWNDVETKFNELKTKQQK